MPWCPKCGSEYRDGFTECASCGVKLVDKLTDEQKKQAEMEERRDMVLPEGMSRPVAVFTAKNRLEAESIEDMLRDNDIPVFDRPAAFRQIQSYSGADARFGVELVVDASQTARARQLIDEMQTELSENESRGQRVPEAPARHRGRSRAGTCRSVFCDALREEEKHGMVPEMRLRISGGR